jgi:hypothetical protein
MASSSMKWNQKSYITSKQYSQDEQDYIHETNIIKDVSNPARDAVQKHIDNTQ